MATRHRTTRFQTLLALAAFCLPMAAQGQVKGDKQKFLHEFPSALALKADWIEYERDAATPKIIQSLIQADAEGKHVVPSGKRSHTSVWVMMDRWLEQHPKMVTKLRVSQNAEAPRQLLGARRSGDPARMMTVYRSYPWAEAVHRSLVESAERALRSGQSQLASRNFQDVLQRSEDAAIRARAQAGYWLAAAHSAESVVEISALFHGVDAAARFPWFGQQLSASEIQTKLAAGMKPASPMPRLDTLAIRTLQLPTDPPWMGYEGFLSASSYELAYRRKVTPVVSDAGTIVAGPCLLASFSKGTLDAPSWSKIATMDISKNRGAVPSSPPFSPLVVNGQIIVRCGGDLAPTGQKRTRFIRMNHHAAFNLDFLEYLAAFDERTGRKIWSTQHLVDWKKLFPVNAPVHHGGRLYLLAMLRKAVKIHGWNDGGQVLIGGKAPIFLIIADATTGRILKQRELVAYHSKLRIHNPTPEKRYVPKQRRLDLSAGAPQRTRHGHAQTNMYGTRLTIHDGAVYVSTAMGAVARCDARDGLIEWVTTYLQLSPDPHDTTAICLREATPPLVGDRAVVFSPRDTVAIFAIDHQTGAKLWQKTEITDAGNNTAGNDTPSNNTTATTPATAETDPGPPDGGVLENSSLQALGLISGSVLVTFDRQLAALDVATLLASTGADLLKIDGLTGKTLETRSLAPLRTDNGFVFDDDGLIMVKPGKHGITAFVNFQLGHDPFAKPKK